MERLLSFSLFFSLLLPLLCIIFLKYKATSKPTLRLPPGPQPLPFIGNLHNLVGSLMPHAIQNLSRRYGPIMLLRLGGTPTIIVSSPDVAKEILTTHDITFASRPIFTTANIFTCGGKGIIFCPYGQYWQRLRKSCIQELLSTKHVQSFRSIREEEVGRLIEHISLCSSRNEVVDLRKKLIQTVNDMISRAIIGNKCKNRDELLQELERTLEILGGFSSVDLFPSSWLIRFFSGTAGKTKRNRHAIAHLLDDIIEQHRESTINGDGEEDFVQLLLRMHDNDTLLDMEAVQQVILDLFTGSTWNMSTTLEWAMSELICNPRVMKKAQSEVREVVKGCTTISESHLCKLNYLRQVIKETLRLHSPPLHLRRQCRERCRISGYDIPEGAAIMINAFAIGTDPNYWEDPEEFKPERFTNNKMDFVGTSFDFLPFGAGRRMCPGISFAMANLEITMASLLYHFDWKQPSGAKPEEIDMSKSNNVTNRRKSPLQLVAIPYKPCVV